MDGSIQLVFMAVKERCSRKTFQNGAGERQKYKKKKEYENWHIKSFLMNGISV